MQQAATMLGVFLGISLLCFASWHIGRMAGERKARLALADRLRSLETERMIFEQDKKDLYGYSADIDKLIPNGVPLFTAEGAFAFAKEN
jgi:hypothetical protein